MKVMILAAGRGERMQALTQQTPKPLLTINGIPLIVHLINQLKKQGLTHLVINVSYLKEKIIDYLGSGSKFGVTITYSEESERLETAGGIIKALPLLGSEPFLVVSSDIYTDFNFNSLILPPNKKAHLVLVNNPPYHPKGDFSLTHGLVSRENPRDYLTFANISIFSPRFFDAIAQGRRPLGPLLFAASQQNQVSGEKFNGLWYNATTPSDLKTIHEKASQLFLG